MIVKEGDKYLDRLIQPMLHRYRAKNQAVRCRYGCKVCVVYVIDMAGLGKSTAE
jgi:hypothetical protein